MAMAFDRAISSLSNCCSCSGRNLPTTLQSYQNARTPHPKRQRILKPNGFRNGNSGQGDCLGTSRRLVPSRSQSPRQPGGSPDDDGAVKLPPSEARITAALVSSGIGGTLAVLAAALAHIDLFGQFRWTSTDDLSLALTLAAPLLLLEAVLFGPRYDLLLAGGGRPGAPLGAVGLQLRTEHVGELLSADSLVATLVLQQACFVGAQVVRGRGGNPPAPRRSPDATSAANPPPSPQTPSKSHISLPVDLGLTLVRETSRELLLRGFLFTFLAAWLTDRAFEAGADDTLTLLPPLGALLGGGSSGEVYLTDTVRLATAALLAAGVAPLVSNEAEALRLGVASNLALLIVRQQEEAQRRQQRQPGSEGRQSEGRLEGGSGRQGEGEEELGGGEAYDEGTDDDETDAMLREYRLFEALGRSTSTGPPRITYALTWLRGLLRFGSVNLTFALTGNLAAALLACALPNLLLLAYIRAGPKVLLERPAPANGQPNSTPPLVTPAGDKADSEQQ